MIDFDAADKCKVYHVSYTDTNVYQLETWNHNPDFNIFRDEHFSHDGNQLSSMSVGSLTYPDMVVTCYGTGDNQNMQNCEAISAVRTCFPEDTDSSFATWKIILIICASLLLLVFLISGGIYLLCCNKEPDHDDGSAEQPVANANPVHQNQHQQPIAKQQAPAPIYNTPVMGSVITPPAEGEARGKEVVATRKEGMNDHPDVIIRHEDGMVRVSNI